MHGRRSRNARLGSASFLTDVGSGAEPGGREGRNARLGSASFLTQLATKYGMRYISSRNARLGSASFLTQLSNIHCFRNHHLVVMPVWAVPLF